MNEEEKKEYSEMANNIGDNVLKVVAECESMNELAKIDFFFESMNKNSILEVIESLNTKNKVCDYCKAPDQVEHMHLLGKYYYCPNCGRFL